VDLRTYPRPVVALDVDGVLNVEVPTRTHAETVTFAASLLPASQFVCQPAAGVDT
jgi:histidinol phosphatase-like enzyme